MHGGHVDEILHEDSFRMAMRRNLFDKRKERCSSAGVLIDKWSKWLWSARSPVFTCVLELVGLIRVIGLLIEKLL